MSNFSSLPLAVGLAASFALATPSQAEAQAAQIKTQLSGTRCMVVQNASHVAGTRLFLYDCNGTENEWFLPTMTGEFKLYDGSMCLGVSGSGNQGDAIVVATCNSSSGQHWVWDNGAIRGINGRCIDVAGGATANQTPILLWDCHGGMGQKWTTQAAVAATMSPRRKLYAFDGTDSREVHHNSLFHVWERWDAAKWWINGPNLLAGNINDIYNVGFAELCNDLRAGRVNDPFIIGYSRGSMIAIKVANYAGECGGNVRFVGLVDAVNTSLVPLYWPTTVRAGIPLVVHLRKNNGLEHVLSTADIGGAQTFVNTTLNATHKQMTCRENGANGYPIYDVAWRWTKDRMVVYASQVGGTFAASTRTTTNC